MLPRRDTRESRGFRSGSHQLLSHAGEAHGGEQISMRQVHEIMRRTEDYYDFTSTCAFDSNAETLPVRFRYTIKDKTSAQSSI